ncbi:hypothetical protein IW136_005943, partial [Coemansia sp. RSA 678]
WADVCDKTDGMSGQWQYKHLRDQGVLTDPSTAAAPMVRTWDNATMTPWLFNPETKMFISYDDPESIQAKVEYAASKGLAGAMVWSIYMDYENELLDTIHKWPASGSTGNTGDTGELGNTNESSNTNEEDNIKAASVGGSPNSGGSCSTDGEMTCKDNGNSNAYYVCVYG